MMNNNLQKWQKPFALLTLIWFLVAVLAALFAWRIPAPGFLANYLSPAFHPRFVTVTIGPLLGFQYLWVRGMVGNDPSVRELSSRRYLIMFLLVAGFLTGLAVSMGFLPMLFHQIAVWPLAIYVVWDFYKSMKA